MDIDLYRIKRGPNEKKYTYLPKKYKEEKRDYSEERKRNVCFLCKQPGYLKFRCPNKIKPKNVRLIMKGKDTDDSVMGNTSNMRRIRRLTEYEELLMMMVVTFDYKNHQKTNILNFFIKTNEIEESKVKVLIDFSSDLNFIHPEIIKKLGIKTERINKSFSVSGLGYGISNVTKETEKCILRYKNHLEIIQFYVLRIPDVDVILGLPWINKHNPSNYHDAKKIAFSSSFCARHCNNGKRRRNKRKRTTKRNKMDFLEQKLKSN